MKLQLISSTEISALGDGSITYVGEWADGLAILPYFKPSVSGGVYSIPCWLPSPTFEAAPDRYTSATLTDANLDWSTDQAAIVTSGKCISLAARMRSTPGGRCQLTIDLTGAINLRDKVRSAMAAKPAAGERSYSFGVSETATSIIEALDNDSQDHINAWLAAPSLLKARFAYVNEATGVNVALTTAEKIVARRILRGDDLDYSYTPTVTMSIADAESDPTDLPTIGATTAPPATVHIRLPSGTWSWRVTNSGTACGLNGRWSGQVTWEAVDGA